ncbi:hypothetical protein DH2020_007369 [Rehmannia glutinosa]|uniref:Bifunctional inhibitor/plant lipid transfer protein/seed storage helical domain-containing protein n=1 Tax=Rehmannia glutinosa TaxID=99300 RepID=A0ABR0TXX4_REHGL
METVLELNVPTFQLRTWNLAKTFLSVSANSTKPSEECCNGAKSWIGAPSAVVCLCFKSSPNRLSYKPTEIRAAALPYECKALNFTNMFHVSSLAISRSIYYVQMMGEKDSRQRLR